MARIRTVKPEFFTSEDIVSMSPMARLLYIATWCEADKEGRLPWKPMTFKLRYFPGDECDINAMCAELIEGGLVVLYGNGFAFIPTFKTHQHINPRESDSKIASPEELTRRHASPRVTTGANPDSHAQGGREGKGKEGDIRDASRDDLPGFAEFWKTWPVTDRKQAKGKCLDAWKKAHAERDAAVIRTHVEKLKSSSDWQRDNGQYIPAPLVYLNGRRWEGAEESAPMASQFAGAI